MFPEFVFHMYKLLLAEPHAANSPDGLNVALIVLDATRNAGFRRVIFRSKARMSIIFNVLSLPHLEPFHYIRREHSIICNRQLQEMKSRYQIISNLDYKLMNNNQS